MMDKRGNSTVWVETGLAGWAERTRTRERRIAVVIALRSAVAHRRTGLLIKHLVGDGEQCRWHFEA
jgi:hypothetical protein